MIIKCLDIVTRMGGSWTLGPRALVTQWWDPIPVHAIVMVCSMILWAVETGSRGGSMPRLDAGIDYRKTDIPMSSFYASSAFAKSKE